MNRYLPILALLTVLAGMPLPGSGQILRGRVMDEASGRMLVGAELVVTDLDGVALLRGFSDTSGAFVLSLGRAGWYRLRVRHIGYAAFTTDGIQIPRDDDVTVQVRMGSEAIPLKPLVVIARRSAEEAHLEEFNARRTNPGMVGGYYLTQEEMARRPMAEPTGFLTMLPGILLEQAPGPSGRRFVRMRNGCTPAIYVDRALVQQEVGGTLDDLLVADQIAGIEVYPRGSGAPLEYQRPNGCGVVMFWTRRPEGTTGTMPSLVRWIGGTGLVVGIFVAVFSAVVGGG